MYLQIESGSAILMEGRIEQHATINGKACPGDVIGLVRG